MLFLIALVVAFGFAFFCHKPLKKHSSIFYIFAILITIVISVVNFRGFPTFVNNYVIALFSRGALATALWCVVMWAGAFPNGSKPIKTIMPIRGELSIFTAILTLGHNIGYGKTYFVNLFTDAQKMSTNQIVASILTIIMLLIMIPLTIMSFPKVRKKMNPKLWKKIQRLAYVFYGLIYVHVMVLCIPLSKMGRDGYLFSIAMYSLVFMGYAVFRIKKHLTIKKKIQDGATANIICLVIVVILSAIMLGFAKPTTKVEDNNINQPNEPVETTIITTIGDSEIVTTTTTIESTQTEITTINGTSQMTENSTITETIVTTETITTAGTTETSTSNVTTQTTTALITTEQSVYMTETQNQPQNVENNYDDYINYENNDNDNNNNNNDNIVIDDIPYEEPQVETEPVIITEPAYIYNNGTYTATAFGYDGDVEITITIENDIITLINGFSLESDTWYFEQASASVYQQILDSQNPNVDAVSGATYSSNAIMSAVQSALNSAKK